jgi:hypothetical protein
LQVTDPAGAVVPNASVNLSSSETGFSETTKSKADGEFHFALVKPGNYTVTVTMTGFATSKRNVIVAIGQVSKVPITLEVSGKVETVEITAATPLLSTENANLNTTVDRNTIEEPEPISMQGFVLWISLRH